MENNAKLNKNSKIEVLYGGMSAEREISLRDGEKVYNALQDLGYKKSVLVDVSPNVAQTLADGGF